MNLTVDQKVTRQAVQRIYSNAHIGIAGHFIVSLSMALLLYTKLPHDLVIFGMLMHMIILSIRVSLVVKFRKIKDQLFEYEDIEKWIFKYRICMFLSGLAFGLLLFFIENLPIEYHFLILSILVGLSSGAIYSVGEVFSVYASYLAAILGLALCWSILQDDVMYNITNVLIIVAIYYFGSIAYRYSNNFKQVIQKEYAAEEHLQEQRRAQNKIVEQKDILDYQAHHDILTDLPNRVLFNDRISQAIESAKRNKTTLAVCFIDLDNFKVINDSLGHEIGDRVLKDVTTRLKESIRAHDTLSRWGGDEFTVIVEDLNSAQGASILSQKILNSLKEPFVVDGHTLYISTSIGISVFPKDTQKRENLIKYADSAMYKAKDEGKNNFQFYSDSMTKVAFERVMMEANIRSALINKEFVVYYQPQIDARDNSLVGMEALVRWEHPTLGLISPAKFIPLAEETGLVVKIDKLVMASAMEQFAKWYSGGYNPGVLSLNLAIKHLEKNNYIEKLYNSMSKFSLDSQYLELELTESDVMKKPEEAIDKLHKISALGIKVAIDDFGTGYSSLSYLKRLPISKLKIDKSFVDDIPHDEDGKSIVKAVIAMAHSLKLDLIAEGVEEEVQKEFLLEHGCNNIQGYYYSKPMSADEMSEFMQSRIS